MLSFNSIFLYSQKPSITFERLGIDQGLSQSSANCILEDENNFLWIGTQEGLNKYYGQNFCFEIFKHDLVDTNSISDIWVYDIAQDKNGNIWIATRYGLNMLNPKTRKIKRYFQDINEISSLYNNEVFSVFVDSKGGVWVKTNDVLSLLDTTSGKFTHYEHYVNYFNTRSQTRFPIIEDKNGLIWYGTVDGLNSFDRNFEQSKRYKFDSANPFSLSNNFVTAIFEDSKGTLWVGTQDGLNKFNKKKKTFERYYNIPGNENSLVNNSVKAIVEDNNGMIWVGTDGGLSILDLGNNKFYNYRNQANNPTGLSNNEILSFYKGSSDIIWIGTNGGGINKVDLKRKKFEIYRREAGENTLNFSSNVIASFFIDRDSLLWVGTYGEGLNIYNRKTGHIDIYSKSTNPAIVDDYVHAIGEDSDGKIWIGTRNGINIYDQEKKTFSLIQDYIPTTAKHLNLNSNRIYYFLEDRNKNMWIASERGLIKINVKTEDIKIYRKNFRDSLSLCDDRVYSIIEDNEGFLWIGTTNGLNKYDPKKDVFYQYKSKLNSVNTISHNTIYSVFEDSEGIIWIGTAGSGLNKYDKKSDTFVYYTEKNGLPNGTIYEIEEDNNGDLWFSTGRGLAKLDKKTNTISSFTNDDGLQGLEFNNGANFKSKDGELFFGGTNGFNSFYPELIKYNENKPKTVFTYFEKTSTDGGLSRMYLDDIKEIHLSYKDHTFKIFFAALEYTKPEKNSYMYMMENLKDEWISLGTQSFKTFSNIPPGEYIFHLKSSNNDLVWNEEPISIKIIIEPPFWQTKWAYVLIILIVVGSIYYFIEVRTRKLKAANHILREKQSAALEIARQKEELTVKNKNITDSINYAKRIQEAMMPSEYLFNKLLPESFILYKPKDIVSGDFYWITEKNNKIFVAAVDCTGHGVPGAFMSIIGFDLLRNITKEQGVEEPAQILNLLNEGVTETFVKNADNQQVKDGMDIALCVYDKENSVVEFAGALNPFFLIRDNDIISIRGNRFSVGMVDKGVQHKFEKHVIPVKEGDVIYIFSDGYADQFGGPFGKKFKYSRFRQLLLTVHSLPMRKQKAFLDENIISWMGELEQVDDILVIGFRINKL
ncbi:MAG: hypothetical protein A2265_03745 [Bacteroidetes bacterium RIFOXYA12_FULL_33_9]|nr:MAG: hypothetical protein A2265_03745 [Bacteroidetes bacterium RIFOXYA12_FULL_33_9]